MSESANPVLIELHHGAGVASWYRGAAIVVDADGGTVRQWGDVEAPTCVRSALKPLQARALVAAGAADALGLTDEHLALACGSHAGEPMHTSLIEEWLRRLGLDETALECGPAWPFHEATRNALIREGARPRRLYHNCSGKHAGFLTVALHMGADPAGYTDPAYLAQQAVFDHMTELMPADPRTALNVDGCMAPNFFAPLRDFAHGYGAFQKDEAGRRLLAAMAARPDLVSGEGRFVEALVRGTDGAVIAKDGAEGAVAAMIPEPGLTVVLKMDDGGMPAAETALCHILDGLGVLDDDALDTLDGRLNRPLRSSTGEQIGAYRPTRALTSA